MRHSFALMLVLILFANQITLPSAYATTTDQAACGTPSTNPDYTICVDGLGEIQFDELEMKEQYAQSNLLIQIYSAVTALLASTTQLGCPSSLRTFSGAAWFAAGLTWQIGTIVNANLEQQLKQKYEDDIKKTIGNIEAATQSGDAQNQSYLDSQTASFQMLKDIHQKYLKRIEARIAVDSVLIALYAIQIIAAALEVALISASLGTAASNFMTPECANGVGTITGVFLALATSCGLGLIAEGDQPWAKKIANQIKMAGFSSPTLYCVVVATAKILSPFTYGLLTSPAGKIVLGGVGLGLTAKSLDVNVKLKEDFEMRIKKLDAIKALLLSYTRTSSTTETSVSNTSSQSTSASGSGQTAVSEGRVQEEVDLSTDTEAFIQQEQKTLEETTNNSTDLAGQLDLTVNQTSVLATASQEVLRAAKNGGTLGQSVAMTSQAMNSLNKVRALMAQQKEAGKPFIDINTSIQDGTKQIQAAVLQAMKESHDPTALVKELSLMGALNSTSDRELKEVTSQLADSSLKTKGTSATPTELKSALIDLSLLDDASSDSNAVSDELLKLLKNNTNEAKDASLDSAKEFAKYNLQGKEINPDSETRIFDMVTNRYKKSAYPVFLIKKRDVAGRAD